MFGFGKKVKIKIPDGTGGAKTVKASQKQWDLWEKEGQVTWTGTIVCANILDPVKGYYQADYLLGQDIDEESYQKFKDNKGDIYILIAYKNGEPQSSIMKKEIWDATKKIFD